MKRQSQAIFITAGLLLAMLVAGWRLPVPYVILSPGSTVNVLGADQNNEPHIQINGAIQYPDDGTLRMVTVYVTRPDTEVSLLEAMWTWVRQSDELLPYDTIYSSDSTQAEETAVGNAQMVSSQDNAVAAALSALGYDYKTRVGIAGVSPYGPSDGVLEPRDWIVAIDGTKIRTPSQVVRLIKAHKPGDTVTLKLERKGRALTRQVTLGVHPDHPGTAYLGVYPATGYDFPIDVNINISSSIGGPSAGLILALAIYDNLTKGSLVGDLPIAGTGEITADGEVGPIGGIAEKLQAAARDGAKVFLVPPGNCPDVLEADVPEGLRLVKAPTFASALSSIKALRQDINADVPECTP